MKYKGKMKKITSKSDPDDYVDNLLTAVWDMYEHMIYEAAMSKAESRRIILRDVKGALDNA